MNMHNHLESFRLWLEPDDDIPQFLRLRWERVRVSIQDVLYNGIHPWMGPGVHQSLHEAFLQRLNEPETKFPALDEFGYCEDVSLAYDSVWKSKSHFETALEYVHANLCFVEDLAYAGLLDIAKDRLMGAWAHDIAKQLVMGAYPGFQELRQFLKRKDKTIKLSGYEELDQYDLSKIVSIDDFMQHDRLIVSHGLPTLNFRKVSFLKRVTDEQGRLRLVPEIKHVTVSRSYAQTHAYAHMVWNVARTGHMLRFRPDINDSQTKRTLAGEFAAQWRTDNGRLCFQTDMDALAQMFDKKVATPSFPTLNYTCPQEGPLSAGIVDGTKIRAFRIGCFPTHRCTGDELKKILRQYEAPVTGNKDQLIGKLVKLAGEIYLKQKRTLDRYFSANQYVRIQGRPPTTEEFGVLDRLDILKNLVLTMYVLSHLRGNVILDAAHENNTYSEEELALALITEKVVLTGAFLCVA